MKWPHFPHDLTEIARAHPQFLGAPTHTITAAKEGSKLTIARPILTWFVIGVGNMVSLVSIRASKGMPIIWHHYAIVIRYCDPLYMYTPEEYR